MAAFRKGHTKVVKWMVKHVCQFPNDQELSRYISTIQSHEKDNAKKCVQAMEVIRVAKDRQAAEAAKNASILLEELDRESKMEQSKKEAAARKREKKKRKKLEKMGRRTPEGGAGGGGHDDKDDDKENNSEVTEDEKEKSPEMEAMEEVEASSAPANNIPKLEPKKEQSPSSKQQQPVPATPAPKKGKNAKKKGKNAAAAVTKEDSPDLSNSSGKQSTPPPPLPPVAMPLKKDAASNQDAMALLLSLIHI